LRSPESRLRTATLGAPDSHGSSCAFGRYGPPCYLPAKMAFWPWYDSCQARFMLPRGKLVFKERDAVELYLKSGWRSGPAGRHRRVSATAQRAGRP
jgi:hypothetical protein